MSMAADQRGRAAAIETPRIDVDRADTLIATVNRAAGDTGVHTHTRTLLAGLNAAGAAAKVVTPFDGSRKWLPIFAVRPLILKRVNPTWSTLWYRHWHLSALRENLRNAVRAAEPKSILAQCPLSARAALDVRAEMGAERRMTISAVCHFNRSEADEYRDKGELRDDKRYAEMLAFEAATLGEVDQVIYVSSWARDLVERDRDIRTRASAVIWNGLADAVAVPSKLKRADVGLSDDDLVLINVGTLEPRKNQVGLIELFAKLVAQHPDAKLMLVGDGPGRSAVESAIARLNLGASVRLLGHRRDVADLMPLADLYIHFALAENCPMVLIEAARAGLPIAALPVGGVPEILSSIDGSVALDAADHQTSLARLRPLLASREEREHAGRRAAEAFRDHFGREAMVKRYLEIIRAGSPEVSR